VGDDGNGWSHTVYTVTPGIPGDSGSAFLDASGNALGVLSTGCHRAAGRQQRRGRRGQGARLRQQRRRLRRHVAQGTEAFTGPLLPV
jgi:hypothetical protein